jgi:hypothetical protein
MRRAMLLLAAMAAVVLAAAGVALAVERIGTNQGEILRGTATQTVLGRSSQGSRVQRRGPGAR